MLIKIDESCLEIGGMDDLRVDKFLHYYLATLDIKPAPSRTYLQDLIKSGAVLVNGETVKVSHALMLDDEVEFDIPEPKATTVTPENIALDIVYEDADLLVINKPINMVTHPAPGLNSGTLVNAVLYHVQNKGETLPGINGVLRPGIVHRLDKDTSGLIVVAKSELAHKSLSEQIHVRKLERKYMALIESNIKADTGNVNLPIGRHPVQRHKMAVVTDPRHKSRRALTYYTVLERYKFKNTNFNLIECKLDTGRTHQIRVHLSYLKHPIIGDLTYGASDKILNAARPMLHAYSLCFDHPRSGEKLSFKAEIPADMQRILEVLRTVKV